MKQTCILVIGMHRSGTSALTGILNILDIYLSKTIVGDNENHKGYFENSTLNIFNNKLLSNINSSWDDIFYSESKLLQFKENDFNELKDIIIKEFKFSNIFAIKDPRLAFLFPIYRKVLGELGIKIKIIIPYRNPVEVANSLNKRDGLIFENAMLLWAYHMLLAEKFSRSYKRVFVEFDALVSESKKTIKLISKNLNINLSSKYEKNKKQIEDFLEPSLKHFNIDIDNLSDKLPIIVLDILNCRDTFNKKNILNKFDYFRIELFDYKKLFYNQKITNTFFNLKQTQKSLEQIKITLEKRNQLPEIRQQELVQSQQALEKTNSSLNQSRLLAKKQKQELVQSQQALEKTKNSLNQSIQLSEMRQQELVQSQQTLEKTNRRLNQSNQLIENYQQELNQSQQRLNENNKQINELKDQIELLKDELVVIYTGRGCEISRFIKKIKGHFK